jgi:hypothetical protein
MLYFQIRKTEKNFKTPVWKYYTSLKLGIIDNRDIEVLMW